jgi:hypothetical protein
MKLTEGYYYDKTPGEEAYFLVEKYREQYSDLPPDEEGYRIWYRYLDRKSWTDSLYYSIIGESEIDDAFTARLHPVVEDPILAKMLLLGMLRGEMGRTG